jgi:hypothetical protein
MDWKGERKENSSTRGMIHGTYHSCVGLYKEIGGNHEGAKAEYDRVKNNLDPKKEMIIPLQENDQ